MNRWQLFFIASVFLVTYSTAVDEAKTKNGWGKPKTIVAAVKGKGKKGKKPGKSVGSIDLATNATTPTGRQCYSSYAGIGVAPNSSQLQDCGNNPCYVSITAGSSGYYSNGASVSRGCSQQSICYDGSSMGDFCTGNLSTPSNNYYQTGYTPYNQPQAYASGANPSYYNSNANRPTLYCCCNEDNCNSLDPYSLAVQYDITPPKKTPVNSCYVNTDLPYSTAPIYTTPCNVCEIVYNYQTKNVQRWCSVENTCNNGQTEFCHNLTSISSQVCCCTGNKCNNVIPGLPVPTTPAPHIWSQGGGGGGGGEDSWNTPNYDYVGGNNNPVTTKKPIVPVKITTTKPPIVPVKITTTKPSLPGAVASTMKSIVAVPPVAIASTMKSMVAAPPGAVASTMKSMVAAPPVAIVGKPN